jgi:hypothetical protein
VTTGTASSIGETTATVSGSVNTDGVPVSVHFDFGTTTAYGSSTAPQLLPPAAGTSTPVSAALSGLPAGMVIHYRAVAQTDFGAVLGPDASFRTTSPPPPPPPPTRTASAKGKAAVKNGVAAVIVTCTGTPGQTCTDTLMLTVRMRVRTGHGNTTKLETLKLGTSRFAIAVGNTRNVGVRLNAVALRLLSAHNHRLTVQARFTAVNGSHHTQNLTLIQVKRKTHGPLIPLFALFGF